MKSEYFKLNSFFLLSQHLLGGEERTYDHDLMVTPHPEHPEHPEAVHSFNVYLDTQHQQLKPKYARALKSDKWFTQQDLREMYTLSDKQILKVTLHKQPVQEFTNWCIGYDVHFYTSKSTDAEVVEGRTYSYGDVLQNSVRLDDWMQLLTHVGGVPTLYYAPFWTDMANRTGALFSHRDTANRTILDVVEQDQPPRVTVAVVRSYCPCTRGTPDNVRAPKCTCLNYFTCIVCHRKTLPNHLRAGKTHSATCKHCHDNQIVLCAMCGLNRRRGHVCEGADKDKITLPSGKDAFKCPHCNMYLAKSSLRKHIQRKHFPYKFKCKLCPKKFPNQAAVNSHVRTYHDKIPHVCKHCGDEFRFQCQLSKHMKTHDVVRQTPTRPGQLEYHNRQRELKIALCKKRQRENQYFGRNRYRNQCSCGLCNITTHKD